MTSILVFLFGPVGRSWLGLFIFTALIVSWSLSFIANRMPVCRACFFADFVDADGLRPGSVVQLGGLPVGEVRSIEYRPERDIAEVVLELHHDYIPVDSSLRILTASLISGTKRLEIVPGLEEEFMKPGNRFFFTQSAVDIVSLFDQVVSSAEVRILGRQPIKQGPGP